MATTADRSQIEGFWGWFRQNKARMDALDDPDEPFWDEALAALRKVHPDLTFALSAHEGAAKASDREFVVTASCDAGLFPLVDALVAAAPKLPGWQWVALKPPMGFDFVSDFEDLTLDPREMWFFPVRDSARPRELALRVGVPGYTKRRADQYFEAVAMILESGLGERAATELADLHVVPLPEKLKAEGYAPLKELPAYIEWNRAHRLPSRGWCGVIEWKAAAGSPSPNR
ncbi:MAG TPA: hypothetical protein VEB22_07230 [Phycisphaerales bacterium]|nr:hypothetical protein [Phycisphaerales bacterium]